MVSWSTYLSAVSVFLVGYYGLVVLVYFRKEIFRKIRTSPVNAPTVVSPLLAKTPVEDSLSTGFQPVSLLDEIHAYMNQAAEDLPTAQDALVAGVQSILQKYPPIEDSFFRLSINDLVVSLAESKCNVEISPDVLRRLWS
ncbi:hypothetical protein [Paraflavitalea pollutisoli]|uniref:hypothetical protein n=1 Tax=Paraflavitalea pollutisoli TaxID=3034143 RepID=UPI0023ED6FE9|nr:hypothetical protein [Paraflavitalea sp. H1-2-19X]